MNIPVILPVFLGNLRGWEWIIIALVVLLLFGGKKIPELMRGLGKGVHSFRKGMQEAKAEMEKPLEEDAKKETETSAGKSSEKSGK